MGGQQLLAAGILLAGQWSWGRLALGPVPHPTRSPGGYDSSSSADSHGCHIRPDLPCSHGSLASISWGIPSPVSQVWGSLGALRAPWGHSGSPTWGAQGWPPMGLSAYL